MRTLKRIFLAIGVLVFVIVLTLFAAIAYTVHDPSRAFQFVQRHFLPSDLKIEWSEIQFHATRENWKHWNFDWAANDFHLQKVEPRLDLPLDRLEFSFSVALTELKILVHTFNIKATQPLHFTSSPTPAPEENPYEQIQSYLKYLGFADHYLIAENLTIDIKDLEIHQAASSLYLGLSIEKSPDPITHLTLNAYGPGWTLAASGNLEMRLYATGHPFLTVDLKASRPKAFTAKQKIEISNDRDEVDLAFKGATQILSPNAKPLDVTSDFHLQLKSAAANLAGQTALTGLPGPVPRLPQMKISAVIPFDRHSMWSDRPIHIDLRSPVELFFISKDMRPPLEVSCACRLPEVLQAHLSAEFWPKTQFSTPEKREPLFNADLNVEDVTNKLFSTQIALALKADKEKTNLLYTPDIHSRLEIHSFQGVRRYLDGRNIMIPAPFAVLDGTIVLAADGPVAQGDWGYDFPIETKINLSSQRQNAILSSTTHVRVDPKFEKIYVSVQALIESLQLELPPLDPIRGIPHLTEDSRIHKVPPKTEKPKPGKHKLEFNVGVDVDTAHDGSIRLLSSFTKPAIPITVHVHGPTTKTEGLVRLEAFQVEYLRRKSHVEYLSIDLREIAPGEYPLKGRLRFDQTQYTVYIDIGGTTKSPQFVLSSKPYLDRSDIISVLIFDQTSDQLGEGDSETAGNMDAAMADRAIGLFGIWALASTPIRSFSYNPATGVYSATVVLADGVTAGVGTNWEQSANVEIRKRIGKRWVVTASWGSTDQADDVGKLSLQWEKRF